MLSITIITKNEAQNLRRLLPELLQNKSHPNFQITDIVILDSGSTDDTEAVARSFDLVQWHTRPFAGYGPQKRAASALARNPWVLNLDADEVPTESFWHGLSAFFATQQKSGVTAATMARDFVLFGKRLRFGGASEQRRIRLFDKRCYDWNLAAVHEDVEPVAASHAASQGAAPLPGGGKIGHVSGTVLHHSWATTAAWLAATDRRALALAQGKITRGARPHGLGVRVAVLSRFFLEFFRSYFIRFGFLDGVPGFVYCFLMAFSHVLKFIKMYELGSASAAEAVTSVSRNQKS